MYLPYRPSRLFPLFILSFIPSTRLIYYPIPPSFHPSPFMLFLRQSPPLPLSLPAYLTFFSPPPFLFFPLPLSQPYFIPPILIPPPISPILSPPRLSYPFFFSAHPVLPSFTFLAPPLIHPNPPPPHYPLSSILFFPYPIPHPPFPHPSHPCPLFSPPIPYFPRLTPFTPHQPHPPPPPQKGRGGIPRPLTFQIRSAAQIKQSRRSII